MCDCWPVPYAVVVVAVVVVVVVALSRVAWLQETLATDNLRTTITHGAYDSNVNIYT